MLSGQFLPLVKMAICLKSMRAGLALQRTVSAFGGLVLDVSEQSINIFQANAWQIQPVHMLSYDKDKNGLFLPKSTKPLVFPFDPADQGWMGILERVNVLPDKYIGNRIGVLGLQDLHNAIEKTLKQSGL